MNEASPVQGGKGQVPPSPKTITPAPSKLQHRQPRAARGTGRRNAKDQVSECNCAWAESSQSGCGPGFQGEFAEVPAPLAQLPQRSSLRMEGLQKFIGHES